MAQSDNKVDGVSLMECRGIMRLLKYQNDLMMQNESSSAPMILSTS